VVVIGKLLFSEGKSSHFAGMGDSSSTVAATHYGISDAGHAFKMKGADTISGRVNGMINVVPAMGAVATAFQENGNTSGMTMASVNDFAATTNAGETNQAAGFGAICTGGAAGVDCLEAMVNAATNQVDGTAAGNTLLKTYFQIPLLHNGLLVKTTLLRFFIICQTQHLQRLTNLLGFNLNILLSIVRSQQ